MKIGIMQPYFFPYIGYWQLMNAVDLYIIYDDVSYIERGWINRNRILINGSPSYIHLPLNKASCNKSIAEIQVKEDSQAIDKCIRSIECAYSRAPYFKDVFPYIVRIMKNKEKRLPYFLYDSFKILKPYLGIKTKLIFSSSLEKNNELRGQDRVLEICTRVGADSIINPIGGIKLYSVPAFYEKGIQLNFLKTEDIKYKQFGSGFQENLSIIDIMMFCSQEKIAHFLNSYSLI